MGKKEGSPTGDRRTIEDADTAIDELNKKHFIVREGGKILIYSPRFDPVLKKTVIDAIKEADFKTMYKNRAVLVGNSRVPLATHWLNSEKRRQYLGGVIFEPSGQKIPADVYNLWQGFAIEPRQGSWVLQRRHMHDVICGMNDEWFAYVMGWLGNLAQNPDRAAETAIVLRGDRGVGKGIVGNAVQRIFGQHGLHITNSKHLVGNFNAHLGTTIFLFVDEALYSGNRAHEGVLKALVTEPVAYAMGGL